MRLEDEIDSDLKERLKKNDNDKMRAEVLLLQNIRLQKEVLRKLDLLLLKDAVLASPVDVK